MTLLGFLGVFYVFFFGDNLLGLFSRVFSKVFWWFSDSHGFLVVFFWEEKTNGSRFSFGLG